VIATLEPLVNPARRERLQTVLDGRIQSVTLVMDAPHDPHNGAAVLRSCDAFGVQHVHVVARREQFLVARRVTQGAERWLDLRIHPTPERAVACLLESRYELVACHPRGELVPEQLATIPRLALVLGNEHDGICAALTGAAQRTVRIPMRGFSESLNVSVSAAVLLAAASNRPADLESEERRRLYARWLHQSLTRATDILAATPAR
jgi:tRNA (guanosine-2'-O-)-methyltransferase